MSSKQIFSLHPFFYFGIYHCVAIAKKEFEKDNFCRRIKLFFQLLIQKIWLNLFIFVPGGSKDMWLTARTSCGQVTEQKMLKNGWPSDSVFGILGHFPHLRTWRGHFQLSNREAHIWRKISGHGYRCRDPTKHRVLIKCDRYTYIWCGTPIWG